jgi:hypothetical protein
MEDSVKVMNMLGCTEEQAKEYLTAAGGDVLEAIANNVHVEVNKHIPAPPVVDDGIPPEVKEKLLQARKYTEMLNASLRNDLRPTQKRVAEVQDVQKDLQVEELD